MKLLTPPDKGGWIGFKERGEERELRRNERNHFGLSLEYDPFDVELSKRIMLFKKKWRLGPKRRIRNRSWCIGHEWTFDKKLGPYAHIQAYDDNPNYRVEMIRKPMYKTLLRVKWTVTKRHSSKTYEHYHDATIKKREVGGTIKAVRARAKEDQGGFPRDLR